MDDHFPDRMSVAFGDQVLEYEKVSWRIPDAEGDMVEKGLRYGENPGQEAALYRLVNGNLALGGVEFIGPGKLHAPVACLTHDSHRKGMLATLIKARSQSQHFALIISICG